jgi:hypothetical protein
MMMNDIIEEMTFLNPAILQYLNNRLEEWGRWFSEKDNPRLDYPSTSLEYNFIKFGCLPKVTPGPQPMPVNEAAEEMEALVNVMRQQSKQGIRYSDALREYYLGKDRKNYPKSARNLGISERQFHNHFKGAYMWLAGWFSRECAVKLLEGKK